MVTEEKQQLSRIYGIMPAYSITTLIAAAIAANEIFVEALNLILYLNSGN